MNYCLQGRTVLICVTDNLSPTVLDATRVSVCESTLRADNICVRWLVGWLHRQSAL